MKVRSGEYVANYVEPVDKEMIQPAGVDLRAGQVFKFKENATFQLLKSGKNLPERYKAMRFREFPNKPRGGWHLSPDTYILRYEQIIAIPDDCIGLVLPRSSLMRAGGMINTAVWDPGYKGKGEGRLEIAVPTDLEKGARIAQLVFIPAEARENYDGQYQGENLGGERSE